MTVSSYGYSGRETGGYIGDWRKCRRAKRRIRWRHHNFSGSWGGPSEGKNLIFGIYWYLFLEKAKKWLFWLTRLWASWSNQKPTVTTKHGTVGATYEVLVYSAPLICPSLSGRLPTVARHTCAWNRSTTYHGRPTWRHFSIPLNKLILKIRFCFLRWLSFWCILFQ